jgi:hypothetical protein
MTGAVGRRDDTKSRERRGAQGPRPSTKARGVPSKAEGRKLAARSGVRGPRD